VLEAQEGHAHGDGANSGPIRSAERFVLKLEQSNGPGMWRKRHRGYKARHIRLPVTCAGSSPVVRPSMGPSQAGAGDGVFRLLAPAVGMIPVGRARARRRAQPSVDGGRWML
jgi:hypothetical protein